MLKPYERHTYISIDNGPKCPIGITEFGLTEEGFPDVTTESYTFQDVMTKLPLLPYITSGTTLFRKRPYVKIAYSWCCEEVFYTFDNITIEYHTAPWHKATLKDIHDYSTADQFLQYLKERGIYICSRDIQEEDTDTIHN